MMTEGCVTGCGQPPIHGSDFCQPCWKQVPIPEQRALYMLGQQLRIERNNVRAQYAYQLALDRAIKKVPA